MNIQGYSSASALGAATTSSTNKQSFSSTDTDDELSTPVQIDDEDAVSISPAALAMAEASEKVDNFLAEEGRYIYETTIKSLQVYPESLAAKLDDDSLSSEERSKISNELTAVEFNAFYKYVRKSPPDYETFFKKYVEYFDSLPPEDQQSERYVGLREIAVNAYQHHASRNGSEEEDLSFSQSPILSLFEALEKMNFNIDNPEKFRKDYEDKIAHLFLREESGPGFKEQAELALKRFDTVQSLIGAAREGNEVAFEQLRAL